MVWAEGKDVRYQQRIVLMLQNRGINQKQLRYTIQVILPSI